MGLFTLCGDDKLLSLLRETFHANPIKIPEERIKPLVVLARSDHKDVFVSASITSLLTDTTQFSSGIQTTGVANVSATRSSQMSFSLGFEIMKGFLNGMGLDGASLKTSFKGADKVSFSFQGVKRNWLDIGALGGFLKGKSLDSQNPATAPFINESAKCYVIDSTLVSDNFTMHIDETSGGDFKLDIPAIKDTLGKIGSKVQVSATHSLNVTFKGPVQLAFAFTAISLNVSYVGEIDFELDFSAFSSEGERKSDTEIQETHFIFHEDYGLIEFDNS